jgi:hypothetical protein
LRIIAPPLAGTFIVEGGTTENSIGEVVRVLAACYYLAGVSRLELLDELLSLYDTGPHITALCFAKVNSISISVAPRFLKGNLNF